MIKCDFCVKSSSKGKCKASVFKDFYCNNAIERMTDALQRTQRRKEIDLGRGIRYRNM